MRVTDDPFYAGLIADRVFGGVMVLHAADLIYAGVGTKGEPQNYTKDERHWAHFVLGKPFDHTDKDGAIVSEPELFIWTAPGPPHSYVRLQAARAAIAKAVPHE